MAGKTQMSSTAYKIDKKRVKELEDKLARALADYQNLAKRTDKERQEIITRSNKNLLRDLLPGLDILERAQEHLKDQGLGMAIDQFQKTLESNGVRDIKIEKGQKFDAERHEATEIVKGGQPGTIAEVLRKGYEWRDGLILRPAQVKVYDGELDEKTKEEIEKELERGDYV